MKEDLSRPAGLRIRSHHAHPRQRIQILQEILGPIEIEAGSAGVSILVVTVRQLLPSAFERLRVHVPLEGHLENDARIHRVGRDRSEWA